MRSCSSGWPKGRAPGAWGARPRPRWTGGPWGGPADLDGVALVVAATDDARVNQQVHDDCRARGLPVNVVDNPALCSFIFPSIVDRSPLMVAVSSAGQSPVLARLLRARLETTIP